LLKDSPNRRGNRSEALILRVFIAAPFTLGQKYIGILSIPADDYCQVSSGEKIRGYEMDSQGISKIATLRRPKL
ncbi:MAG: hypothetical protein QNJ46_25520, partial [Leptolyngbyaceae cyanobacterium MO_188.B28]|nr:hypothetical protein [Leptolyngbyaceae cyanobacterium MO_188.B28]